MRLIDADALKAWIKTIKLKDLSNGAGLCRVIFEEDFMAAVHDMPKGCIVDAVPVVHGRWNKKVNPKWPAYSHDECSNCGWCNARDARCYGGRLMGHSLNYCPNCGARMDGGA